MAIEAGLSLAAGLEGQECMATIVLNGWVRFYLADLSPLARAVSTFLNELAFGGLEGIFARVDHPSGDLEGAALDPVPPLLDKNDESVGGQSDHIDPIGCLENKKLS